MFEINASIALNQGRIWCSYRTQHLFKFDAKCYITELNSDLEPISYQPLVAENGNTAFEDVRLFSHNESLLAFYTYFPKTEEGGWKWEYGVGAGLVDTVSGVIRDQISLRCFSTRVHEKNWCPYSIGDDVFLITDYEPRIRILKIQHGGLNLAIGQDYLADTDTKRWQYGEIRGGTPLLRKKESSDGWMYGFVHSYLENIAGFSRKYFFTAVRFNHHTKQLEYYPEPLDSQEEKYNEEHDRLWHLSNWKQRKVIFPMGIMHYKKGVLVSFGRDDVSSFTRYFRWKEIDNLFS